MLVSRSQRLSGSRRTVSPLLQYSTSSLLQSYVYLGCLSRVTEILMCSILLSCTVGALPLSLIMIFDVLYQRFYGIKTLACGTLTSKTYSLAHSNFSDAEPLYHPAFHFCRVPHSIIPVLRITSARLLTLVRRSLQAPALYFSCRSSLLLLDLTFNLEKYQEYSPMYISMAYSISYGLNFAAITGECHIRYLKAPC